MLALLGHPNQLARLRTDPGLLPDAVEEFLRYDGPISTSTLRYTTEPVTIGEVDTGQHLAFGHGVHYCLGAPLARVEGEIAFRQLLQRFPKLDLAVPAEELEWREGMLMHGLTSLPLRAS